jgi:hypothetical protein
MKKLLFVLALFSGPALAEPVMPGPDASYEERREYMNQVRAESDKKYKEALAESEQRMREFNVKIGLPADHKSYGTGRGCRYSCVTTVYVGSKMYRVRVSTQ